MINFAVILLTLCFLTQGNVQKADYDWTIEDLRGNKFSLSETKNKVVFINIWATWCPPCRDEMPSLQKLYDRFKDNEKIIFLFVSYAEESETVVEFMKNNDYTLPVYITDEKIPSVFDSEGIPVTFIISKTGIIELKKLGGQNWDTRQVHKLLEKLAKQ